MGLTKNDLVERATAVLAETNAEGFSDSEVRELLDHNPSKLVLYLTKALEGVLA